MPTIYIEIYMVFIHDRSVGRKYAILSTITQPVGAQRVSARREIFGGRTIQTALRNMPNRAAIHGLSSLVAWPFEVRMDRYRNAKDA